MSNFDENVIAKLRRLEREVERLKVGEKANNDGWIPVSSTWTYASATTINVPSGAASIYSVGDKFKLTANSVVLQGYVVGIADTVLTVVGDALTNHTFSACYYSHEANPVGFKQWFNWTPTITAGAGTYTSVSVTDAKFQMVANTVNFRVMVLITTNGTAAGYMAITLPVNEDSIFRHSPNGQAINNGTGGFVCALQCSMWGTHQLYVYKYDGTYAGANGVAFIVNGSYKAA